MDGGKLVGDLNEVAKKRLPDHEMAVVVTVFLIANVDQSNGKDNDDEDGEDGDG